MGSLTSPANHVTLKMQETGPQYGLQSLSETTWTSNHLQVSLQSQHILLSYFKTLSVGLAKALNPRPPARQSDVPPTELTGSGIAVRL